MIERDEFKCNKVMCRHLADYGTVNYGAIHCQVHDALYLPVGDFSGMTNQKGGMLLAKENAGIRCDLNITSQPR